MVRCRAVSASIAASLAITAVVSAAAGAGEAWVQQPASRSDVHRGRAAGAAVVAPPLGEVTVHGLGGASAVVAATQADRPSTQSVVQEIRLTVIGGELSLETTSAVVVLEQVSEREWVGVLPPVRVVDARGTHEGWDVRWSVNGVDVAGTERKVPDALVRLEPNEPVVVAGLADGVVAGKVGPGTGKGRTLFEAEPGWGGGTYEAGGAIRVRLPGGVDATSVAVHLTFDLA